MVNQTAKQSSDRQTGSGSQRLVKSFWGVRYQVKDVSRSVDFYTQQLGVSAKSRLVARDSGVVWSELGVVSHQVVRLLA
jgi:hypothetical protein